MPVAASSPRLRRPLKEPPTGDPFTYSAVHSEQEAIEAVLAGGRHIAGGTTLIDVMREEVERPEQLIDINALALRHIRSEPDRLVIGALARMADVASDPVTSQVQPMLVEALVEGASPQLRNMASIGGNLLLQGRAPATDDRSRAGAGE